MIVIHKGTEPEGLKKLREEAARQGLSPTKAYEKLCKKYTLKKRVRQSLVTEQGSLCAYCMCKIPRDDVDVGIAPITIEHYDPRNPEDHHDRGQGLDYNNFLAVCNGNRASKDKNHKLADFTCDAFRENKEFRKINPTDEATLKSIQYTADGRIFSLDPDVQYDLNDVLNLNCPTSTLIAERKAVYEGIIYDMKELPENELESYCKIRLESFESENNPKTPYVGVLIWYLRSMLEGLENQ